MYFLVQLFLFLFVLFYCIARQSFQHAIEKLREVRTKNSNVPMLLVGNKVDKEGERYGKFNRKRELLG